MSLVETSMDEILSLCSRMTIIWGSRMTPLLVILEGENTSSHPGGSLRPIGSKTKVRFYRLADRQTSE